MPSIVPSKIDFRDCVHQGIAGPTPQHILASIRAEYCMPPVKPSSQDGESNTRMAIQIEDFAALERALGGAAFRQLTSDFHRRPDASSGLVGLPEFLAQHRYGRATTALVDLARLERALILSERAPRTRSIGACCLPPEILRAHPDLTLSFHPAWQWLDLGTPSDHWRNALLGHDGAQLPPPAASRTRLRIHPEQDRIVANRLTPAGFGFEYALLAGQPLRHAIEIGHALSISFDPLRALQSLLMAGAVTDSKLHPSTHLPDR